MKVKFAILFLASVMVISAFSFMQVYAHPRDKSDVSLSPMGTDWVIEKEGPMKCISVQNGNAIRWQQRIVIKNIGNKPLTNALFRVRFWGVTFENGTTIGYSSGGNDALAIVDGLISVTNGEKLPLETEGAWMVAYYISAGTIQPQHTKNIEINILTDGQIADWTSYFTLWIPKKE